MTQSMYQSDKIEMKKVIAFFWGDRVANSIRSQKEPQRS